MSLLVAIGVNGAGYREVLSVESAGGEKTEAYRNLLKGLIERGLQGVQLVISDDHASIKAAVSAELPGAKWQRCVVHFERNILAHVPSHEMKTVADDLKTIFAVSKKSTARTLAEEFGERYRKPFPKAVETLERGLDNALTYLAFPNSHYRFIRTTNPLERLFKESETNRSASKQRTRVVGVFPNEQSTVSVCAAVLLRATEEWRFRKYLDMEPLKATNSNPQN